MAHRHVNKHQRRDIIHQAKMVRLGCKAQDIPYILTIGNSKLAKRLSRILYNIGIVVSKKREREKLVFDETAIPQINTSYGKHVDWSLPRSQKDKIKSACLQFALRYKGKNQTEAFLKQLAVSAISKGQIGKATGYIQGFKSK